MNLNQVNPSPEQLAALASYPKERAIVMVNIIRYKRMVHEDLNGEERYRKYMKAAIPFIEQVGAKVLWKGRVEQTVIGEAAGQPDIIFMVEYPSVDHFLKMLNNKEYQKITTDRTLALEYGGLLACSVSGK